MRSCDHDIDFVNDATADDNVDFCYYAANNVDLDDCGNNRVDGYRRSSHWLL